MTTSNRRSLAVSIAALILALVLAAQVLRLRAAEHAVRYGQSWGATVQPNNARAQALIADRLIRQGNEQLARAHALKALENSLLQVRALRTLALIADKARPGGGQAYWRLAAAHGWRDGPTQLWAFRQALIQGELDIAITRADAFLRTRSDQSPAGERQTLETLNILRQLGSQPAVARQLAERLVTQPEWRRLFFGVPDPVPLDQLNGMASVADQLGHIGGGMKRQELYGLILGLIRHGHYQRASLFDRRFVARQPDPGSLMDDGEFGRPLEAYQRDLTPFDWLMIAGPSNATASLEAAGGDTFVATVSDGSRGQNVFQRYWPLPPGAYRLGYSVRGTPADAREIYLQVRCADETSLLAEAVDAGLNEASWQRRSVDFQVSGSCPIVVFRVGARGSGVEAQADFDDFVLSRSSALPAASS